MITVNFTKLHPKARMPTYATDGAAGLDLYWDGGSDGLAGYTLTHQDGATLFSTGIAIELPEGYEGQIRPRSSMSLHAVQTFLGTIDSDYRGEIRVLLKAGYSTHRVLAGDRIAQLVIAKCERAKLVEVDALAVSARGPGGFGSTGR